MSRERIPFDGPRRFRHTATLLNRGAAALQIAGPSLAKVYTVYPPPPCRDDSKTLRVTPTMEAGIVGNVWTLADLMAAA